MDGFTVTIIGLGIFGLAIWLWDVYQTHKEKKDRIK